MNKKSFFLGVVTGIVLTLATLFVIAIINKNSADNDSVQYLEQPVSYENKKETSFKVLQVLGNAALATDASDTIGSDVMYFGNTVLVLGEDFYNDQIVTIKSHHRVGTYSYTTNRDMPMTVPVIDGEME